MVFKDYEDGTSCGTRGRTILSKATLSVTNSSNNFSHKSLLTRKRYKRGDAYVVGIFLSINASKPKQKFVATRLEH